MSNMRIVLYALILCLFTIGVAFGEAETSSGITDETEIDEVEVVSEDESEVEQIILFDGNVTLPEGNVSVEAFSGNQYEFPASTPMGALLTAASAADLNITISDKPMAHKGILALDGINDYMYSANNTWYVVVNDYQLKEYVIPETDGMNIYSVHQGDELAFYYGLPIKPASEALAAVFLSIE